MAGAEAGLHMVKRPRVGQTWLQGISLDIDFLDCARVFTIRHQLCLPIGCYSPFLRTHERSPLDPEGGIQTKFHARGVGIVQVGALDDPEGETLVLMDAARLSAEALAIARAAALRLDSRAYSISEIYGHTPRAECAARGGVGSGARAGRPEGHLNPPAGADPGPRASPAPAFVAPTRAARYTAKVNHPLVPLASVRRRRVRGPGAGTPPSVS